MCSTETLPSRESAKSRVIRHKVGQVIGQRRLIEIQPAKQFASLQTPIVNDLAVAGSEELGKMLNSAMRWRGHGEVAF